MSANPDPERDQRLRRRRARYGLSCAVLLASAGVGGLCLALGGLADNSAAQIIVIFITLIAGVAGVCCALLCRVAHLELHDDSSQDDDPDDSGGGGGGPNDDSDDDGPSGGEPFDWESFERQFRAYAERSYTLTV